MAPSKYAGLDDEVVAKIEKFETAVKRLAEQTKPLTTLNRKSLKKYSTFNRARIALATAYASVCMYIMSMKAGGETLDASHPINLLLARVKEYFGKIESSLPDAIRQQEQRKRVDASAVKRIVKHDMGRDQRVEAAAAAARAEAEEEVEEIEEIEEVEEVEEDDSEDPIAAANALVDELAVSALRARKAPATQPAAAKKTKREPEPTPEPPRKRRKHK